MPKSAYPLLTAVLAVWAVSCGPDRQPPHAYNQLETMVMDRPDQAALICRFKTHAPPDTVWQRIATGRGLERWAADSAHVELNGGGRYRMVLPGGHRIDNAVRSFVAGKKLTYDGGMKGTWVTWQIESLQHGGARVTFAASGVSDEWRGALRQYKEPTAAFVQQLVDHLGAGFP